MAENKLMIGAGVHRREGWKALDADPKRGGDFVATLPPLPDAVKQIQWDEIEWIHGVTSLYPWEANQILSELQMILRVGGTLVLEQPNFNHAVSRIDWLFGDPVPKNPLHMNRWAYTPETLTALVLKAGFGQVRILAAQHHFPVRDFRLEATK